MKLDGREIINKEISWKEIKVGDVVLEGNVEQMIKYCVLTRVINNYWEYFNINDGYLHSTSPEYCYYLVLGQKNAGGTLIKIN